MKQKLIKLVIVFVVSIFVVLFLLTKRMIRTSSELDLENIVFMGKSKTYLGASYYVLKDEKDVSEIINHVAFDYLVYRTKKYSVLDLIFNKNEKSGELVVDLFDIESEKRVKSFGQSKWNKEMDWAEFYFFTKEDKKYLMEIYVVNDILTSNTQIGYVVFDIDANKVVDKDIEPGYLSKKSKFYTQIISTYKEDNSRTHALQSVLKQKSYIENNNLKYDIFYTEFTYSGTTEFNGVPLVFKVSDLPENNTSLYEEFPCLLEARNDTSMQDFYVLLIFPYSMNADEVVRMITEEGHEVSYEGVYVSEESSIDGKNHNVHSFEEYMQYFKVEE